jgi:hypothetical protein
MSLIAKPVINKQYWILQEDDQKVGNVEACAGGYQIKINNQVVGQYKTIKMVEQRANIRFEPPMITTAPRRRASSNSVHGYATAGRAYNPVWDVKMKLPIYTKTSKSKSWFAAGWYAVYRNRTWRVIQDPKLITLQRYQYRGPFQSEQQAQP